METAYVFIAVGAIAIALCVKRFLRLRKEERERRWFEGKY